MRNNTLIAYTDGSYSKEITTEKYGSGIVLIHPNKKQEHISRFGYKAIELNNIAGELSAAMIAMLKAKEYGYKKLIINYDYIGISYWATGEWKPKNKYVKQYVQFYRNEIKPYVDIEFVKVKGHSGDIYNNLADILAKRALYLN